MATRSAMAAAYSQILDGGYGEEENPLAQLENAATADLFGAEGMLLLSWNTVDPQFVTWLW